VQRRRDGCGSAGLDGGRAGGRTALTVIHDGNTTNTTKDTTVAPNMVLVRGAASAGDVERGFGCVAVFCFYAMKSVSFPMAYIIPLRTGPGNSAEGVLSRRPMRTGENNIRCCRLITGR
jgi:hypothetical protein